MTPTERAAFERGVRAALEAAERKANEAIESCRQRVVAADSQSITHGQAISEWIGCSFCLSTIRAIDPATVKGDTDNG